MFGLGMQEIIVIGVLALLLLGPKKLPELAQTVGKFVRDFQRAADEVKREITTPVNDIKAEMRAQAGLETMDRPPPPPQGMDASAEAYGLSTDPKATVSDTAPKPAEAAGALPDAADHDTSKPAG